MQEIQVDILNWYNKKWEQNLNKYPWRIGKKTPYEILVAELVLYRTTAKAVVDNKSYDKFLNKFPSINTINETRRKELVEIFEPVGLYNQKADRILALKEKIMKEFKGKIPDNKKDLLTLPGIKEYIANAVLTFAYDQNEVPLDGNLERIAFNVWKIKNKESLLKLYKNLAGKKPKQIYWALFDIGRFHCRKPIPICEGCPLRNYCSSKKQ